jgi:hypothetical protein
MRSSLASEDLRNGLRILEKRKSRPHILPSDVSLQEAEAYWKSLNYNTARRLVPDGEDAKVFRPEKFVLANESVEQYRMVSREGRRLSQEMEKARAGLPKIMLDHGVYEEGEDLFFKEPEHAPGFEAATASAAADPTTDPTDEVNAILSPEVEDGSKKSC